MNSQVCNVFLRRMLILMASFVIKERSAASAAVLSTASTTYFETTSMWTPSSSTEWYAMSLCNGFRIDLINNRMYCLKDGGSKGYAYSFPFSDYEGKFQYTTDPVDAIASIEKFCPMEQMCSTANSRVNVSDVSSYCCLPCCSESCRARFRNSIRLKDTITYEDTGSLVWVTFNETHDEIDLHLVEACAYTNEFVEKCEHPSEMNFDDVIPVYSFTTKKIYRNIFCARCNNDSANIVSWNFTVICPSVDYFRNNFPNTGLVLLDRDLIALQSSLPDCEFCVSSSIHGTRIQRCFRRQPKAHCDLEKSFQKLCSRFFAPVRGRLDTYQNVFCLYCNEDLDMIDDTCSKRVLFKDMSFTIVLNAEILGSNGKMLTLPNDATKKSLEVPNCSAVVNGSQCADRTCALTEQAVDGKCIPALLELSDVNLDLRLQIVYTKNQLLSNEQILQDARQAVSIEENSSLCSENIIWIRRTPGNVLVVVQLLKTISRLTNLRNCYEQLQTKLAEFSHTSTGFTVQLIDAEFDNMKRGYINFGTFKGIGSQTDCGTSFALSELQFCEALVLRNFRLFFNDVVEIFNLTFVPGEYVPIIDENWENGEDADKFTAVHICSDTFEKRISEQTVQIANDPKMSGIAVGRANTVVTYVNQLFFASVLLISLAVSISV